MLSLMLLRGVKHIVVAILVEQAHAWHSLGHILCQLYLIKQFAHSAMLLLEVLDGAAVVDGLLVLVLSLREAYGDLLLIIALSLRLSLRNQAAILIGSVSEGCSLLHHAGMGLDE